MAISKKSTSMSKGGGGSASESDQNIELTLRVNDEGSRQVDLFGKKLDDLKVDAQEVSKRFQDLSENIKGSTLATIGVLSGLGLAFQGVVDVLNSPAGMVFYETMEAAAKEVLESTVSLSEGIKSIQRASSPLLEGMVYGKNGKQGVQDIRSDIGSVKADMEDLRASYDAVLRQADRVDSAIRSGIDRVGTETQRIQQGLGVLSQGTGLLFGADEPVELFNQLKEGVSGTLGAISSVSEEIFFVGSALEQLKAVVMGGPYDLLIGQNVRLQEQLLSTKASIVANNKVIQEGRAITEAGAAIDALAGPIDAAISKIRRDSLDLVGVTSKDLVEVFGIISQQISGVGLSLDQAADLTSSFAAGLGTIGLPLDQARQEIQSILTGTIDVNSVLAKSLGITNAQLKTWIAQDTVYERMTDRLSAFVEGNAQAAATIGGVSSNIQEVIDEIGRAAGVPLMDPIVKGLDQIYSFLQKNAELISKIAGDYLGRVVVAVQGAVSVLLEVGEKIGPSLAGIASIIGGSIISAIEGFADGIASVNALLGPFLEIFGAISVSVGSNPFLRLFVQVKVLETAFSSLVLVGGSLVKVFPIIGETLFIMELRSSGLVSTILNLNKSWGLFSSTILVGAKYLESIPGGMNLATQAIKGFFSAMESGSLPASLGKISSSLNDIGQQFPVVARLGDFFSGSIAAIAPQLAGGAITMIGFAQAIGIGREEISAMLGTLPNLVSGLGATVGKATVFGVEMTEVGERISEFGERLNKSMGEPGDLFDKLDDLASGTLRTVGEEVRNQAIRYGLWGVAIVGVTGAIAGLIVRNETLRYLLAELFKKVKEIALFIADKLFSTIGLITIGVVGLTAAIGSGLATEIGRMVVQLTRLIATNAPLFFINMAKGLETFKAALALPTSEIGSIFSKPPVAAEEVVPEPQTFGDLDLRDDEDGADRKEKRRKKVGGGKRTGAAADRLDEILDLSEAQAEAANKAGLYEQGMIGSHKSTERVSKSAKGASVQVTALGQAQQFATATAATLSATFKALFVTLGPIVAIIALFSAWGYAIEEVTKASRMQKEMQEELLAVLKEQEETIEKIKNLQDKPVLNALADQITEADLKTNEERIAFREGGGEAVLAVREARNINEEGKEKSGFRKSAERTIDVASKASVVVPFFRRAFATAVGDDQSVAQAEQRMEDLAGSTTALRTVQANQIAGTETLVGAGEFLASTKSETAPVVKDLGIQVRETEKLLEEAQAKGSEARARELEGKLEQEKAAYEEAQDQILAYAGALEKIDFATAAQKETALAYADDLRGIVQDIEAEIEVAGVDFARLGTSFEQLEVESSNALAFFERGEGNPEQVAQRAGQLLSATQQQLEEGFISSEQALANYAVLFKRNNALELGDQQKLQEAILAARKKQTESAIKLEEAKVAKLKQLAAEGEVGQFESELGNVGLEREKAKVELEGLRSSYEEQNRLRVANFEDTRQGISREIARSKKELSEMSLGPGFQDQREALQTEIRGYYKDLETSSESFRNQQRSANRNFATEEANLLAQIAESANQELQLRLKELEDQASAALDRSATFRKAQLQELRKEGVISEEQQNFAIARSQQDRNKEELVLERKKLQELLKNPKRFEREIRESNSRLAQLTLERFESERSAWEAQLALYKRYVDDQAEAARNAIEVENQELIKQAKLYEAIAQGIDQRNALLQKAQGFVESTGGSVADSLERIAKLTGNEVLQADIATNAAIIRRETLAKQLEIQTKIFEIEQKQAEIALIRREAENQIAIAKAKQQIISAQGELVVAQQQFERGDITEAELTSKKISLLTATTELQGLKLEEGLIQQEKELQPVLQGLLKAQQEQQMQSQLDQADIAVLETMPQALAMDAMTELGTRFGERLGFTAKDLGELATQMREARGQLQGGYAQEVYGDANIFDDDISFREAQLSVGPGARNIERLKEQGIDLGFYTELGDVTASPVANVDAQADGEGFFVEGDTGEAGSGLFDEQTGPLGEILAGVETATTNMDESIAQLEESLGKINLDNLQEALPELVGRDAIVETTFEAAGNVEQAIEQAIQESNAQLETITTGLEPLAEVRDFLGADGPLNKSLENLDLSPYLGENMDLLKDTGAIAQGVEQIVAQMPKAGEEAPAPAEGEGVYGPPLPGEADRPGRGKREIDNLSTRDVNTFLRQFEELISPEALEKARARGSEDGRRVTEGELRTVLVDTLRPMFLSAGSQSRLEQSSTSNILAAFRSAFGVQEQNESRGGRGGRSRTQYEIKPNLTFNINGNADENKIARTAMREFETILDRTLASAN